jgi:hypothetical protein
MICIIPYKRQNDGTELRYAIRSLVLYFSDLDDVILIGDKPSWYRGRHIQYSNAASASTKEGNLIAKVKAHAPSGPFLYSNDDFFLNHSYSAETLPAYYSHTCRHMALQARDTTYRRLYSNCLPTWLNYDVHVPSILNGDLFRRLKPDGTLPIRTGYFNKIDQSLFKREEYADNKIRGHHTYDELQSKISIRPFFSTHETAINDDLITLFDQMYPNATRFES